MTGEPRGGWVEIGVSGWSGRIEYRWAGTANDAAPLLVMLHEGLGSVAMWRDFPEQLCAGTGARALVYSRPGYGRSTPRPPEEKWPVDFMHQQAHVVLPALLDALEVHVPVWLFGHSDGGSIALLHAARFPRRVAGCVVLAPHLFVEDLSVRSITAARQAYGDTDLRSRLARYHDDVDSAFCGWNDIWLDPAFRSWNIEAEIRDIRCPILAVQGEDDEYGTMAQIEHVALQVPRTTLLKLTGCGHSPHRDRPQALIQAVSDFLRRDGAARPPDPATPGDLR